MDLFICFWKLVPPRVTILTLCSSIYEGINASKNWWKLNSLNFSTKCYIFIFSSILNLKQENDLVVIVFQFCIITSPWDKPHMKIPNGVSSFACASSNLVWPFSIGRRFPFSSISSSDSHHSEHVIIKLESYGLNFLIVLGDNGLFDDSIHEGGESSFLV